MISRWLYTFFFYLLLPVVVLRLLFRSLKAPAYRQRWAERFGIFQTSADERPMLWLHAVSVGELLAAVPLIQALLRDYPGHRLVVTTTTPTGSDRVHAAFAAEIAQQRILHVYAPYDLPFALARFLNRCHPRLIIIMETELWPNLIHACATRKIPVILANARLSEKSAGGYARLAPLTRAMLAGLEHVAAQNIHDGKHFEALGLPAKKLTVTGSIKFDLELSPEIQKQAEQCKVDWSHRGERLIWLAASTHPGEDEMIMDVFGRLLKKIPSLLLVLVPRHPERFNNVAQLFSDKGFRVQRRSDMKNADSQNVSPQTGVLLGDTMGELLMFYGACDVAFVGGSLLPIGGHNLIEPAAWGKPVISGKYLHNFSEVSQLLCQREALLICHSTQELEAGVEALLLDESRRKQMGARAKQVAEENRGALQKLLRIIKSFL